MSFISSTILAAIIRTTRVASYVVTALTAVWYLINGVAWIEYIIGMGLGFSAVATVAAMGWELWAIIRTSRAFEAAKDYAYASKHLWAYRKAADLAIPFEVALENVDFGTKQWSQDYYGVLVDNVAREAAYLRKLANGTTNW